MLIGQVVVTVLHDTVLGPDGELVQLIYWIAESACASTVSTSSWNRPLDSL